MRALLGRVEQQQASDASGSNHADLAPSGGKEQNHAASNDHDGDARHVSAEVAGHAPNRLGDDGNGHYFQTLQSAGRHHIAVA